MQMIHSVTEQSGFLRFGYVSSYDPANHTARVIFPALNDVVSAPLPVCTASSSGHRYETHFAVGTHVACLMSGLGTEAGVIIGTIYDDSNAPPVSNPDIEAVTFSDGSTVQYNTKENTFTINVNGSVKISGLDVTISGNSITLETGSASVSFGKGAANIIADAVRLESNETNIIAENDIAFRAQDGSITTNKDIITV